MPELTLRRAPLGAAATLTGRCVRLSARNTDALVLALALPVMLMLLFVYLFGGEIDTGTRYVTYVVPGVLVLCAGFGAATTAVTVAEDLKNGIVDRFRSMDVGGASFLTGHVLASVARNCVATAIVFAVAFAIGFRPGASAGAWFAAVGLLVLYILVLSWISAAVGLLVNSPEAAGGFTFFVSFLPYPSPAFVRVDTLPGWLQGFAEHQPVGQVVEVVRALLLGRPVDASGWLAPLWCAALLALAVLAASRLFARRAR